MNRGEYKRLADWLGSRGLTLREDGDVAALGGGLANRNERIDLADGPAVLRRPPPGVLAAGANDMAREWRVLSRLAPAFALAPRPLAFCEAADVLDTPFLVLEWRRGRPVDAMPPRFGSPAGDARLIVDGTIGPMAMLHALNAEAIGLGAIGRPDGFYARQLDGWARRAAAAWPDGVPAQATRLTALLGGATPSNAEAPVLLHMDPKPDNLLFDERLMPTAMLDWDMATRGPRGFDLAVLLSYWIEPGDPLAVQGLRVVPSLEPGWPDRAALIERYRKAAGIEPGDLVWPVGLARLRLAVAWVQLYRKWQRGELTGDRYGSFETLALAVLDHAADRFEQGLI